MSFQSLVSGSECAVNPLSQVLKHTEGDRSLQQDRISGPSSSRLHHLPGTSAAGATEHDLALARQFFDSNGHSFAIPRAPGIVPGPSLQNFDEAWRHQAQPQALASWAAEFSSVSNFGPQQTFVQNSGAQSDSTQRLFTSSSMYGGTMPNIYSMGMPPAMYPGLTGNLGLVTDKGKGKSREADFEAAFAQVAASLSSQSEAKVQNDTGLEDALGKIRINDALASMDPSSPDVAKFEAEINQLMSSQREELDFDYGASMQQAWEDGLGSGAFGQSPIQYQSDGVPILEPYSFDQNNKYLDPSTSSSSFLNDAKALLEQNGSLTEAALLLEAAIQKGDLGEGGYEAWILLGETRNMDEREEAGMRALTQGVKIAEEAGAAGVGMVSLAISFTNESFDRASYTMLLRWLRAKHPSVHIPEDVLQSLTQQATWSIHERVTELFLGLARSQHAQNIVDPDVQTALGVLFYTNSQYDRAKDCFESAVSVRPRDYLMWNRLGSALSNGSKPEEALGAYREALQLRPTYTRAIYNVGVACLNIGAYKEAAEHFLSALALQETKGRGDTSDQLWITLKRTFHSMERPELAELANPDARSSLDVFRREGFDF